VLLEKNEELTTFLTSVIQRDGILEAAIEFAAAFSLGLRCGFVCGTWLTLCWCFSQWIITRVV